MACINIYIDLPSSVTKLLPMSEMQKKASVVFIHPASVTGIPSAEPNLTKHAKLIQQCFRFHITINFNKLPLTNENVLKLDDYGCTS